MYQLDVWKIFSNDVANVVYATDVVSASACGKMMLLTESPSATAATFGSVKTACRASVRATSSLRTFPDATSVTDTGSASSRCGGSICAGWFGGIPLTSCERYWTQSLTKLRIVPACSSFNEVSDEA